ncbi:urease accessory protein UreH domain-containing protein [Phormidesmis priestleyi]
MIDLFLVMMLGFLGSFGHCVGMCGPLTVAFSLSAKQNAGWRSSLLFHSLLNLGRILSYVLVGAGIGAIGSVLLAGGQLAGIESDLRRGLAIFTGLLLIWMGLSQINPKAFAKLPIPHPFRQQNLHQTLSAGMSKLSLHSHWWTPLMLGLVWGLIPCGFLYAAQLKAAETGSLWKGSEIMLAFGFGTLPSMLGVGLSASLLSGDRRSQLFRMGGWVTLTIGLLTLLRSSEMQDYTGHAALLFLMLALIARPISRLWAAPLKYRRALGVGAFICAVAHTLHMVQHTLNWNLDAIAFMLPEQQAALWAGVLALTFMIPAAVTSCDRMVTALGPLWRRIHLLNLPALGLAVGHTLWLGSHYFGALEDLATRWLWVGLLVSGAIAVFLIRLRWFWSLFSLQKYYASALKSK